jgi:Protein of unknown function C-terminus (DUF2451)
MNRWDLTNKNGWVCVATMVPSIRRLSLPFHPNVDQALASLYSLPASVSRNEEGVRRDANVATFLAQGGIVVSADLPSDRCEQQQQQLQDSSLLQLLSDEDYGSLAWFDRYQAAQLSRQKEIEEETRPPRTVLHHEPTVVALPPLPSTDRRDPLSPELAEEEDLWSPFQSCASPSSDSSSIEQATPDLVQQVDQILCLFGRQQQQQQQDPSGNDDDQGESCFFRLTLSSPNDIPIVDRVANEPDGPRETEMARELHGSLVDTSEDDLLDVPSIMQQQLEEVKRNVDAHLATEEHIEPPSPRVLELSPPTPRSPLAEHDESTASLDSLPWSVQIPTSTDDLQEMSARLIRRRRLRELSPAFPETTVSAIHYRDALPDHFFQRPVDAMQDTEAILEQWMPPLYDDPLVAAGSLEEWDANITQELSRLDGYLYQVQHDAQSRLWPHRGTLENLNRTVPEYEAQVQLAMRHVERSAAALQAVSTHNNPLELLRTCQLRHDLLGLGALLVQVKSVQQREQDLWHQLSTSRDYQSLRTASEALLNENQERLSQLVALRPLRERLGDVPARFRQQWQTCAAEVVALACRRGSDPTEEYARLWQSVWEYQQDYAPADENDLAQTWCKQIEHALCQEADRMLALALLHAPEDDAVTCFAAELGRAQQELDRNLWIDRAHLRTWTHNLVTIRFALEQTHVLGRVMQELCCLLVEVLRVHWRLVQWHERLMHDDRRVSESSSSDTLSSFYKSLNGLKPVVWNHCERVIVNCVDEYLSFSKRGELFGVTDQGDMDDSLWWADLLDMEQAVLWVDRFLSMRAFFFNDTSEEWTFGGTTENADNKWELLDKVSKLCHTHLRSVHVASMKSVGRILANESWLLQDLGPREMIPGGVSCELSIEDLVASTYASVSRRNPRRVHCAEVKGLSQFAQYDGIHGNPLREAASRDAINESDDCTSHSDPDAKIVPTRDSRKDQLDTSRISTESINSGLVPWMCRLLHILQRLPMMAGDIAAVIENLSDLYCTTVFRIVSGSRRAESILLGAELPSTSLSENDDVGVGPPLFGLGRQNSSGGLLRRSTTDLGFNVEATICAPLPKDRESMHHLGSFIVRARNALADLVDLDRVDQWMSESRVNQQSSNEEKTHEIGQILEKRVSASNSCLTVAALVSHIERRAASDLKGRHSVRGDFTPSLVRLSEYVASFQGCVSSLVSVSYRMACTRSISAARIVGQIVDLAGAWEESKLNEHSNDYIEELTCRCSLLWGYLSISGKLPGQVVTCLWEKLVSACYLTLLEGFARVPYCTTEGRALMALDLASLAAGLDSRLVSERLEPEGGRLGDSRVALPPLLPRSIDDRGMYYVDMYVKVFYYPDEDRMEWIKQNYSNYPLHHMMALIGLDSPWAALVRSLYAEDAQAIQLSESA